MYIEGPVNCVFNNQASAKFPRNADMDTAIAADTFPVLVCMNLFSRSLRGIIYSDFCILSHFYKHVIHFHFFLVASHTCSSIVY